LLFSSMRKTSQPPQRKTSSQPPHRGRRHLEVDVFFAFLSLGKKRSGPKFTKRQKN
jgi:hypothetical protein